MPAVECVLERLTACGGTRHQPAFDQPGNGFREHSSPKIARPCRGVGRPTNTAAAHPSPAAGGAAGGRGRAAGLAHSRGGPLLHQVGPCTASGCSWRGAACCAVLSPKLRLLMSAFCDPGVKALQLPCLLLAEFGGTIQQASVKHAAPAAQLSGHAGTSQAITEPITCQLGHILFLLHSTGLRPTSMQLLQHSCQTREASLPCLLGSYRR